MMPDSELVRLERLLETAMALDRVAKGNIQILDPRTRTLRILVHRGFDEAFLRHFATVQADDSSACGRALGAGDCIMIPDVLRDEAFAPHRSIALSNGFRSVKSIPVAGAAGEIYGMLSTHAHGIRWDWERDNTRHIALQVAEVLAGCRPGAQGGNGS
jgi:GAF domain-containing protein